VLGTEGNSTLGGIDFDHVVKDIIRQKFVTQHGWKDISMGMEAKILKVAESVKKALTVNDQEQVDLANEDGVSSVVVTRQEFERHPRTLALINEAIKIAKRVISGVHVHSSNIRMILMIGGTSKLPILQAKLREEFAHDNLKIVFPDADPQLMVVMGASIVAGSYAYGCANNPAECAASQGNSPDYVSHNAYSPDDVILEDVLPLALGFSVCKYVQKQYECGIMDVIVPKNAKYPTKSPPVVYCQKEPISTVVNLSLYEGDEKYVKDNFFLGSLEISGIPPRHPDRCESILVNFLIDKNGIAEINAVVNDNEQNPIRTFETQLHVAAKDGSLGDEDIKRQKEVLRKWFPPNSGV